MRDAIKKFTENPDVRTTWSRPCHLAAQSSCTLTKQALYIHHWKYHMLVFLPAILWNYPPNAIVGCEHLGLGVGAVMSMP
jgi:hypothetical protein